jgi:heptosyltransferase II
VALNPSAISRLYVRATNWLGDAVMSLPAIRTIREIFPHAYLAVVARSGLADLYARESVIDHVIPDPVPPGLRGGLHAAMAARRAFAQYLRGFHFDCAILLQNAFDAALVAFLAGVPERIGYRLDGRGLLLTRAVPVPEPGEIPRHERFYYLELLRRAGLMECFPPSESIRLEGIGTARESGLRRLAAMGMHGPAIGISPGAAYGNAKRWLPERFAETAGALRPAAVLLFGSPSERSLCETVAASVGRAALDVHNLAGQTTLSEFIDLAAACRLFLTNDSGAMHVASALGVPTIAIFGATDDTTTGPTGPLARVVREHAECSPCLLRECPIDHRCMTRVTADRVAAAASELLADTIWTQEARF